MASSMIHYIVSQLIADKIGVKDLNMFLIGAVLAPDHAIPKNKFMPHSYCIVN